jgi:LysR family transcriptional regulator for metE and metH
MERIAWPPHPRLEVRDLRLMLALDTAGTTARAAELLHLSQPAVSRALVQLEGKLGVSLFDRSPRGLKRTAAGERLRSQAVRLLTELSDLEQRIAMPAHAQTSVRLVCECYTAYHWLPSALLSIQNSLPEFELTLAVEHTRAPVAALEAGKLDAALLTSGTVPSARFDERELFSDEVVFVMSRTHPLAERDTLTRADLRANPLLTSESSQGEVHWFMSRACGRGRPQLNFMRFPVTEAIIDTARAGMGIAILSEWIVSPHILQGELIAKRLAGRPLLRPWRLAWRRDLGDAALRLVSALASTAPRSRLVG